MKIAQIVCVFPPYAGGIGQSAYRLGEILSREHQVKTFTLSPQKKQTPEYPIGQQEVIFLDPVLRFGHGALPLFLPFRLFRFDVIYLHYPFFGADALILLLKFIKPKKKLIIHYHMDTPGLPGLKRFLSLPSKVIRNKLLSQADKIIVSSRDYAENGNLAKIAKKHNAKIKDIPFGIETDLFKPKIKEHNGILSEKASDIVNFVTRRFIKKGGHSLLFVGGLDEAHYFKGLSVLLKAISNCDASLQLNIIGEGELRTQYEKQALQLGLNKKVKFLGRVSEEDLVRQYQSADLLVLPSINSHEAFGLVLIEAMACGLPVIASDLPGVRSVFEDEKQGLLCRPGDIQDLRQKICTLVKDDKLRQKMSIAARHLVEEKYAWEKVADRILDEFSNLD
jgi:glycosyltransferase involved in cell wall biosynthesis